ncbi:hypothetical protein [Saccharibacillus qingshengii]|uniref:hypothetical protein n=1 Tax=Saccharibacillus qingshengii TaxID=1763540 RepID=UPI0015578E8B|nr:hypothetical protein [Saccharibacillus qingshengii]
MPAAGLIDYATLFGGFTSEVTAGLTAAMPIAVPIAAAILGVGIGFKVIKKFAK